MYGGEEVERLKYNKKRENIMGQGIDYGRGQLNIDHKTGIRYGVIHNAEVVQAWYDESEPFYVYYCPYCGYEFKKKNHQPSRCPKCRKVFKDYDLDMLEPVSFYFKDKEYIAEQGQDDCDIFIMKSPYYTLCRYCSPCAPGAGYIMDQDKEGIRAYCFGHDWFENGKAPYKVYDVKTEKEVLPE